MYATIFLIFLQSQSVWALKSDERINCNQFNFSALATDIISTAKAPKPPAYQADGNSSNSYFNLMYNCTDRSDGFYAVGPCDEKFYSCEVSQKKKNATIIYCLLQRALLKLITCLFDFSNWIEIIPIIFSYSFRMAIWSTIIAHSLTYSIHIRVFVKKFWIYFQVPALPNWMWPTNFQTKTNHPKCQWKKMKTKITSAHWQT